MLQRLRQVMQKYASDEFRTQVFDIIDYLFHEDKCDTIKNHLSDRMGILFKLLTTTSFPSVELFDKLKSRDESFILGGDIQLFAMLDMRARWEHLDEETRDNIWDCIDKFSLPSAVFSVCVKYESELVSLIKYMKDERLWDSYTKIIVDIKNKGIKRYMKKIRRKNTKLAAMMKKKWFKLALDLLNVRPDSTGKFDVPDVMVRICKVFPYAGSLMTKFMAKTKPDADKKVRDISDITAEMNRLAKEGATSDTIQKLFSTLPDTDESECNPFSSDPIEEASDTLDVISDIKLLLSGSVCSIEDFKGIHKELDSIISKLESQTFITKYIDDLTDTSFRNTLMSYVTPLLGVCERRYNIPIAKMAEMGEAYM
jgi:hypothetical protein